MQFTLNVWRQPDAATPGRFETYTANDITPETSFLEMIDIVNEQLVETGAAPVAFDHDCREGICGMCSMVINGIPHGGQPGATTCQLHMRSFPDGATITIEPFRAAGFPLVRDLVVDRSAFDRIIQSGGYVSVNTGGAPDANMTPVSKPDADAAMDAAQCIGCGACVAACKNASASLFAAAKVAHLATLPQGQPEQHRRVKAMVEAMDRETFGSCTNTYSCQAVCPKDINVTLIGDMNRAYRRAVLTER